MKLAYHGFQPLSREERMGTYNESGGWGGVGVGVLPDGGWVHGMVDGCSQKERGSEHRKVCPLVLQT